MSVQHNLKVSSTCVMSSNSWYACVNLAHLVHETMQLDTGDFVICISKINRFLNNNLCNTFAECVDVYVLYAFNSCMLTCSLINRRLYKPRIYKNNWRKFQYGNTAFLSLLHKTVERNHFVNIPLASCPDLGQRCYL